LGTGPNALQVGATIFIGRKNGRNKDTMVFCKPLHNRLSAGRLTPRSCGLFARYARRPLVLGLLLARTRRRIDVSSKTRFKKSKHKFLSVTYNGKL